MHARNFVERFAAGKSRDGVIEFLVRDEINRGARAQSLFRMRGDRRADERDLQTGIEFLHPLSQLHVISESDVRGEENYEIVIFGDLRGLFGADVVRGASSNLDSPPRSRIIAAG